MFLPPSKVLQHEHHHSLNFLETMPLPVNGMSGVSTARYTFSGQCISFCSLWPFTIQFNINALYCTSSQREDILALHSSENVVTQTFSSLPPSQDVALRFLKTHKLDREALDMPESKWSVATSRSWGNKGCGRMYRSVYQWYLVLYDNLASEVIYILLVFAAMTRLRDSEERRSSRSLSLRWMTYQHGRGVQHTTLQAVLRTLMLHIQADIPPSFELLVILNTTKIAR